MPVLERHPRQRRCRPDGRVGIGTGRPRAARTVRGAPPVGAGASFVFSRAGAGRRRRAPGRRGRGARGLALVPVDAVLLLRREFAEGQRRIVGLEHRVVAEPLVAARRPDQLAEDPALEQLLVPVRPGQDQGRDEVGPPVGGATGRKLALDARHRAGKVLRAAGPAGREQPGRSVERVHAQARIVREGRQPGGVRRRPRLDGGVLGEHRAGLVRLGQVQLAGRDRLDAEGGQQLAHLAQLAGIVGRDHDPPGEEAAHQAIACFWSATSSATPALASRRRLRNSSSENGFTSAVPCTSTMPPLPVMTKLASVSAPESSA